MTLLPPGCQLPHAGVQVERVRQPPRAVPHQDVRPRQRPSWGQVSSLTSQTLKLDLAQILLDNIL